MCQDAGRTTSVTQPHRPYTNGVVTQLHTGLLRLWLTLATARYRRKPALYVRPAGVVDRNHQPGRRVRRDSTVTRRAVLTLYPHCAPKIGVPSQNPNLTEPGMLISGFVQRIGDSVALVSPTGLRTIRTC